MKGKHKVISGYADVLSARAKTFCDLAQKTLTDFSEETIHDFRVSTRRLQIVEILLGSDSRTNKWKKHAKQLLKQLNRLRDLQVMLIRFQDDPLLASQLSKDIEYEISMLGNLNQDIALQYIKEDIDYSLDHFREWLAGNPEMMDQGICHAWSTLRGKINYLIDGADPHDYKLLHSVRIRLKSMRYLVEILLDAGIIEGVDVSDFKLWQDFLGNIQDLTVATRWLEGRDGTETIREQLHDEMEQQRAAFWEERENLLRLLDRLDGSIAGSLLSCP